MSGYAEDDRDWSGAVTRFAPSPTGYLHLGHVYSAAFARRRAYGGSSRGSDADTPPAGVRGASRYLVRIEDIDIARSRPEWEKLLLDDLDWLGLASDAPVIRQSERLDRYHAAVAALERLDVVYPCFCTRREIEAELAGMASAPHGPHGALYPGTCRRLSGSERVARKAEGRPFSLRLDAARAAGMAGPLAWVEEGMQGGAAISARRVTVDPHLLGDVILARKDAPTSYHIAVVVDDADQGITVVTRGADLFSATHVHRLLQELLCLPAPRYHHHPLVAGPDGKRLAKRADSLSVASLRTRGYTAQEILDLALAGPFVEG